MHAKTANSNQSARRLLFSAVALSLMADVHPFFMSHGSLPASLTALRTLKMVDSRSGDEPTRSSITNAAGNTNRFFDANFKRRDVLNVLLGFAVAGAGVESSYAVSVTFSKLRLDSLDPGTFVQDTPPNCKANKGVSTTTRRSYTISFISQRQGR
jgi:hypothetical protein